MANNHDFTLKRNNGNSIDILYPTTRWAQVEEKPTTFTPTAHSHGNITDSGSIGSVPNLMIKTGTGGKLTTLSAGSTSQFLRGDGTWATPVDETWKLIRDTEIVIPTTLTANNVTVVSGNYYGKTLAFEVRANTNNDTYETHIVFARMGSNTSIATSSVFDRFYGWSAFDGLYLKNHSFKAYCSNVTSTTITVGAIKHLVGYFLNNTIEWTTPTLPTYIERIWLVN